MLKESFGEIGEADQWPQRARVQSVDLKHVFNRRYERGVLFLRDTPVLAAVRLKPVFFNALRTDSSEILSTSSSSTTRSARSWSVQRAQPSGGSKQANALISASSFPSTLISRRRDKTLLALKGHQRPVLVALLAQSLDRTDRHAGFLSDLDILEGPPSRFSSLNRNTLARCILCAETLCLRQNASNCSRSGGLNLMRYFLGIHCKTPNFRDYK